MSKVVAPVLFLALVGAVCSLDPFTSVSNKVVSHFQRRETLETKQYEGCSFGLDYPDECLTASNEFANLLNNTENPSNISSDALNAASNEVCASECLGPQVQYLECVGLQDLADLFNTGYCGQSGGTNCYVLWREGLKNGSVLPLSFCVDNETCDSECQVELQTTADYLGCCAASFYDNPASPFSFLITPTDFATCNVTLGEKCRGVISGAPETTPSPATTPSHAGINRVGLGLLTAFVAVAATINAST